MRQFEFNHTEFPAMLRDFARTLGDELRGKTLYLKPEDGEGYFYADNLPNGLSVLISRNSLHYDSCFHRYRNEQFHYILCFEEIFIKSHFVQILNGIKENRPPPVFSGAYLNTTLFDKITMSSRGNGMRMVRCIFPAEWLATNLGISRNDKVLNYYLALRARKLHFEPIDAEYRIQMDDIFDADPENPLFTTIAENRIMLLLEIFFSRMYKNMEGLKPLRHQYDEIYRMMEVETDITSEPYDQPPTVEALGRKFKISASRLKRQFKHVYGLPLYEYYQKFRMLKAKDMLLTGQYSVKEVGFQLGYQNLSNFASAFKKEFGVLPSKVVR